MVFKGEKEHTEIIEALNNANRLMLQQYFVFIRVTKDRDKTTLTFIFNLQHVNFSLWITG